MSERQLATIRTISGVHDIPGADFIVMVEVDGWQCVAKKGEFQSGDYCVYFEIDSVLPVEPRYEFLRKDCFVSSDWVTGFRLRTRKFKKQISQGLVLPLSSFEDHELYLGTDLREDLTELLNVVKWDPPVHISMQGRAKGNFPMFIPKTDEPRIQNVFNHMQQIGGSWEATLKLDGSSLTMYKHGEHYGVCSRNLELVVEGNEDNPFVKTFLGIKPVFDAIGADIALQGELMGPGIQGNREGFTEHKFFLYKVWDIKKQEYYTPEKREKLFNTFLRGVAEHVPVLSKDLLLFDVVYDCASLLALSKIKSINNPVAEGIVYKSNEYPDFSFKAINNEYLLAEK